MSLLAVDSSLVTRYSLLVFKAVDFVRPMGYHVFAVMMDPDGYLILVLHSHMPYLRYPDHPHHLEETWLYEAITESYLPLLDTMGRLLNDGIGLRLTLSLTPSLLEMLSDDLLVSRYEQHLDRQIELAGKEVGRTADDPAFAHLATMYAERFAHAKLLFRDTYRCNLPEAFAALGRTGCVELITSAATHAYLPAHLAEPSTARAQLLLGSRVFTQRLGIRPAGVWLPECGYAGALDHLVRDAGFRYFIVEAHGLLNAAPRPRKSIYAPVTTPAGTIAFGRDVESAKEVWSSIEGYPGDPAYREFYRDIGFDLDHDYLLPYLPGGVRSYTGFKYYRVTGKTDLKEPYNPARAREQADEHAARFLDRRARQAARLKNEIGTPPVITAAYDAELFGHWWFEGPFWLEQLFRRAADGSRPIRFTTPSEYLAGHSVTDKAAPAASSWGERGFSGIWIDHRNCWIYRHLHKAAKLMRSAAHQMNRAEGLIERVLNQAGRELLLAQASDWPFMMQKGNAADFAEATLREHLKNFFLLHEMIATGAVSETVLVQIERKNRIFPDLDFRIFAVSRNRP